MKTCVNTIRKGMTNFARTAAIIYLAVVLNGQIARAQASCASIFSHVDLQVRSEEFHQISKTVRQEWVVDAGLDIQGDEAGPSRNTRWLRRFESDTAIGTEKLKLYERLGFRFDRKQRKVLKIPTWIELASRYHYEMKSQGLNAGEYLRPTIIFSREIDGKTEYVFVDPFTESIPDASTGFSYLRATREDFNIPDDVIRENMAQGKFPLMGGMHDIAHYALWIRHPALNKVTTQIIAKENHREWSPLFQNRLFLLMEYGAFPDPNKKSVTKDFLRRNRGIISFQGRDVSQRQLQQLSVSRLISYVGSLSDLAMRVLIDTGGGSFNSYEKVEHLDIQFRVPIKNLLDGSADRTREARDFHFMMYRNGENFSRAKFQGRAALITFIHPQLFVIASQQLKYALEKDPTNQEIRNELIDITSSLEYLMTTSVFKFDLYGFAQGMLNVDLTMNDPVAIFLDDFLSGYHEKSSLIPVPEVTPVKNPDKVVPKVKVSKDGWMG